MLGAAGVCLGGAGVSLGAAGVCLGAAGVSLGAAGVCLSCALGQQTTQLSMNLFDPFS